eukprot:COSAG02_NODE_38050_length_434_cov_0.758209_2_plen_40_part_01
MNNHNDFANKHLLVDRQNSDPMHKNRLRKIYLKTSTGNLN